MGNWNTRRTQSWDKSGRHSYCSEYSAYILGILYYRVPLAATELLLRREWISPVCLPTMQVCGSSPQYIQQRSNCQFTFNWNIRLCVPAKINYPLVSSSASSHRRHVQLLFSGERAHFLVSVSTAASKIKPEGLENWVCYVNGSLKGGSSGIMRFSAVYLYCSSVVVSPRDRGGK